MGALEVADLLEVKERTVHMWKHRSNLPPGEYASVNGSEAWERASIIRWAGDTGRIRAGQDDLAAAFRDLTGREPIKERGGGRLVQNTSRAAES